MSIDLSKCKIGTKVITNSDKVGTIIERLKDFVIYPITIQWENGELSEYTNNGHFYNNGESHYDIKSILTQEACNDCQKLKETLSELLEKYCNTASGESDPYIDRYRKLLEQ